MGNSYSIFIQLHKERGQNESTPVTAGSILQGKVIVEITSPLYLERGKTSTKATNLSLITLRIYGKEKVCMKLSAARKRARVLGHRHLLSSEYPYPTNAERQFFDVNLPLREFPQSSYNEVKNCINPGTYKFPFQVHLPAVLPATSSYNPYTRGQHSPGWTIARKKPGFRIQYKIFAEIHSVVKKGTNGENIRTPSQLLWVVSAPKTSIHNDPMPAMILPVPHEVTTSHGFWTQGTILTAAFLEDSIISRSDDHINLHVACRNNSRAGLQRVQLHLVETIRWGTVASTGEANDSVLQEQHELVLFSLSNIELPSLEKERLTLATSLVQSVFGTKNKQEREFLKSIHADLQSEASKLSITLPLQSLARDTYSGQLVQVSHHIEINFQTEGKIKRNNLSVIIPIRMVNGDRHSIEATGSFCNSVTESDTPAYEVETGCDHVETIENEADVAELQPNENEHVHMPSSDGKETPYNPYSSLQPMAVATIDNNGILLGGDTSLFGGTNAGSYQVTPLSDLEPMIPNYADDTNKSPPSLGILFSEMRSSVDAYNIVKNKSKNPLWIHLFENLSPYEFGQVISRVADPFDQPRVAVLLGQHLNQKKPTTLKKNDRVDGLTCEYLAFAIRNTSEVHRATTAKGLLPMCVDAAANYSLVIAELNEWDQTVVLKELESAIVETMPKAKKGFLNTPTKSPQGQLKLADAC